MSGRTMSKQLVEDLALLREKKPDLIPAISCYALFARGVRLPDDRLSMFGAISEKRLSGMIALVETELEDLREAGSKA